jgi:glycosyltransferase involved in cell wall biosynthesis
LTPLRVGLNLLHLVPGETGGSEIYARRLLPALLDARPSLELIAFVGREAAPALRAEAWATNVEIVPLPVNARSRTRRVLAEQTLLPAAARKAHINLLHNLFTTAPALPAVPQVTTILDLIYKRFPTTHAGAMRLGMTVLVPLAARRSRRIIAISEAAKGDVVRFLGVPADHVDVTYLGPSMPEDIKPMPERELRARLALTDAPIVLTVSAKRPHKNLERLFEAFARVEATQQPVLVVPGYETPFEKELRRHAGSLTDQIRFTGWLDDTTLAGLYAAALVFVFPSLAEGFGLPVLEAMRRGVPVACSNATSLPEVAGDAALYFEPTDTASITAAIEKLLVDGRLRERLRAAGLDQARGFSWQTTAEGTLTSYARALGPAASSIASSS